MVFKKGNKIMLGKKHSEETKRKWSLARKGIPNLKLRGRKFSEETKRKMSEKAKLKVGEKNPFYGKHHTKENKKIMSEIRLKMFKEGKIKSWNKGIPCREETKIKLSNVNKGKKHSEETKRKMSLNNSKFWKGKHLSEETKRKISDGHKGCKSHRKGLSVEEEYGKEKAKEIKRKSSARLQGIKLETWKKFTGREPYDQRWDNVFKRRIRKRDNYICMMCSIHQEKIYRALDIHHINYDKQLSIPQNCISLCSKCHKKTNGNRKHFTKFFQSLMNEKYGYEYNNQEIILTIP